MRIARITVENFRSIESVSVAPLPLPFSIFVGQTVFSVTPPTQICNIA